MATFDLGRVTPLYKGDYSASASYELNDVVLYNGNLYWHVQATPTVGILPTDTTVWKLAFADEGVRAEIRGYADNAQASADSALASKSAAAQSASQASASESQAAQSAQTAQTAETGATASAQTASTKASEATASAQSAASSAQTATDKATLATNKAQAASESASLATAKASAAATSETNAAASAQTATAKASEAAASATSAQEYDESAQASAVNAQTAQTAAETAQTAAETAQGLAEDARDEAQQIKDNVEDAIADKADSAEIGDLSQLTTTAKDNLVSAINEENESLAGMSADVVKLNGRLLFLEDELGVNPPDVYTGTITQPNVNTTIADNLSFARSTQYKFTFSIESAINSNVYVHLKRGGGSDSILFSKTIAPGETSAEKLYTTSASYDITEGYILASASATGVTVKVAIEPAEGVPSRLDDIEADVTAHGTAIGGLTSRTTVLEAEVAGIDVSVNRLNPFTVTTRKYINMSGASGNDTRLLYTDYIKVNPGDIVYLVKNGVNSNAVKFRYVTAYDSEKVVISASGKETSWRYTVPDGVYYIIMTLYIADYEGGGLAININGVFPYTAYNDAADIVNYAQRLKRYPYTTLPDYVLGGAWYKPLGGLSKGYFCFVTDDGRIGMNEYTIPTLVIGKGVKCTFAIMSASEVMADAEKIAVVKDAVDNYGCSVAQHGGNRWTQFDEYQLNEFFDTEKAFFDGIGIEVRGAVIPEHYNSQLIYAVAGGKYGVVRSGYNGHVYPTVCPYENYSNGPRSNLYGLTSYNIVDMTLAGNKAAVDNALTNNRLMIVYIHENSFDDAKKAVIEGLMDYVNETGITQITLGDIPNII